MENPFLNKHLENFSVFLGEAKPTVSTKLDNNVKAVGREAEYAVVGTLGHGSYGVVLGVKHLKQTYAMKVLTRNKIDNPTKLNHVRHEIRILNANNFPYVLNLVCYFTTPSSICIVTPYINGINLFDFLKVRKHFEERVAMFYAGQVILGLEYLHYMGVVYRDLKPENIMLNSRGYAKLIDFGFAKKISHKRTYSFCGTPEYLPPEMILNEGHTYSVDWWTLGIFMYELVVGQGPFYSSDPYTLYRNILVQPFVCSEKLSPDMKSLSEGLLKKNKVKRLGSCGEGATAIKSHKWFASLNWDALWQGTLPAPLVPARKTVSQSPSTIDADVIMDEDESTPLQDRFDFGDIDIQV